MYSSLTKEAIGRVQIYNLLNQVWVLNPNLASIEYSQTSMLLSIESILVTQYFLQLFELCHRLGSHDLNSANFNMISVYTHVRLSPCIQCVNYSNRLNNQKASINFYLENILVIEYITIQPK